MNDKNISELQKVSIEKLQSDFSKLVIEWSLTESERQALLDSKDSSLGWGSAKFERMTMLIGIQENIHQLYPESVWKKYIRSSNKHFDGQSPLKVMLSNRKSGLADVQAYLKSSLTSGFS